MGRRVTLWSIDDYALAVKEMPQITVIILYVQNLSIAAAF